MSNAPRAKQGKQQPTHEAVQQAVEQAMQPALTQVGRIVLECYAVVLPTGDVLETMVKVNADGTFPESSQGMMQIKGFLMQADMHATQKALELAAQEASTPPEEKKVEIAVARAGDVPDLQFAS